MTDTITAEIPEIEIVEIIPNYLTSPLIEINREDNNIDIIEIIPNYLTSPLIEINREDSNIDITESVGFIGSIEDWLSNLGKVYIEYILETNNKEIVINHNLNSYPQVITCSLNGSEVETEITFHSSNTIKINTSFDTTLKVFLK